MRTAGNLATANRKLPWRYRGVLPVQDDLGDVVGRVQQVVVPPLVPVDGHGAVFIHAAGGRTHQYRTGSGWFRHAQQDQIRAPCCRTAASKNKNKKQLAVNWRSTGGDTYCRTGVQMNPALILGQTGDTQNHRAVSQNHRTTDRTTERYHRAL